MVTYYIATDGDDGSGDGSEGNPWATLTQANTGSGDNDTIILKDGTYTWSGLGAMTSLRTYQGGSARNVIIDGGGGDLTMDIGYASSSTTISNIRWTNIIRSTTSPHHVINGKVSNWDPTFTNCIFDNLRTNGTGFNEYFLDLPDGSGDTITFNSCLFYKLDFQAAPVRPQMFEDSGSATYNFNNCTIVFDSAGSFKMTSIFASGSGTSTINMTNCIIVNSQGGTVNYSGVGSRTSTLSNVRSHNITSVPSGTNMTTGDPIFVGPATANFNLAPTSDAIGQGVAA